MQNALKMPRIPSFKFTPRPFGLLFGLRVMFASGIMVVAGCAELPLYEPIDVYLRTNPPLEPYTYNLGTWRSEGQRLTFSLREDHFWEQGGADTTFPDGLVRGQELQYRLRLENFSNTDPVEVQVDLVHYGDTVWSGTHLLRDLFSGFYSVDDTNATKTIRFIWN